MHPHAPPHRVLRLRRHRHHRRNLRQLDPGAVRGQAAPRAPALHRQRRTRRTRWCARSTTPPSSKAGGRSSSSRWSTPRSSRSSRDRRKGMVLDMFNTFVEPLEAEFGMKSNHRIGRFSDVAKSQEYNDRIEAINFSLAHDDGQSAKNLAQADVILVGVSRSGKTPTSLYLAMQHGIKAANYPLIPEDFERGQLPSSAGAVQDEVLRPDDRPGAAEPDPQRAPPEQQVRVARELPLRGERGRDDDAPRRHRVAVVDAQVDRGDRDDDPARPAARPADVLTRPMRRGVRPRGALRSLTMARGRAAGAARTRTGRSPPRAATFSDSSPPGCGMRTASAQRAQQRRVDALPFVAEHPGAGPRAARAGAARRRRGNWWPTSGTRRASRSVGHGPSTSRSPKCAPMPARSTFGDHSAAVPLSAITCAKPNAAALRRMLPTLPASCSRSSTTVGASARIAGGPASGNDEAHAAPAIRARSARHQRVGQTTTVVGGRARPASRSAGRCPARSR